MDALRKAFLLAFNDMLSAECVFAFLSNSLCKTDKAETLAYDVACKHASNSFDAEQILFDQFANLFQRLVAVHG